MDYELQLKIKNAPLLNLMRENGYQNAAELARGMGISRSGIDGLLSLKTTIYGGQDGNTLTKAAKQISAFFHVHPEELAPESHIRTPLKQSTFTAQVAENQLKELSQATADPAKILEFMQTETRDAFEDMLEAAPLRDRYKDVLRYRQRDGLTLDETAKKLGVTRERIRQMEAKAYRTLRHPKTRSELLEASGIYAEKAGVDDWWEKVLKKRRQDGRKDAEKGVMNTPYIGSDDPQDQDEKEAYRDGWRQRRAELGEKFKWQNS